jgi:hypothetical protein
MTLEELIQKTEGNDGIASESTAKKILKALEGGSGGRSGRDTEEQSKKVSTASKVFSKVVKTTGAGFESLSGGSDKLVEGLAQLASSSRGLNKVLLQVTATLAARVFENVDVFRNLAEIGAVTSANLSEFRYVAATAGIDMTRLATALISTNTALTGLGGDAAKGARVFNKIMAEITNSDFTDKLVALGFSMGDITEGFADYVTLQTRLGRAQSMSQGDLISGSQEYLLRLDQLSRLTGLQRDQVKDELQAVADARELRLISNKEIEATMVRVKAAAPEMVSAVTGLLAKGFPEGGEQVGIFAVEGVREAVSALRDGVPGASDMFIQALARNGENIANMDAGQKKLIATQLGVGNEFFNIAADSVKFRQFLGQSTQEIIDEQEQRAKNSEGARKFADASENLRSTFQGLLVPFQKVTDTLIGFLIPAMELLTKGIESLSNSFNDWFKSFDEEGQKTIATVTGIAGSIVLAGTAFMTFMKAKSAVSSVGSYLTGGGGGGGKSPLPSVGKKVGAGSGGLLAGMGGGLKGLASGLTAMANPATLLGAANLGLAITAVGAGLAAATFLMGGALEKFSSGLKGFSEVDGGNLLQVAKGTLALSGAMAAMGAGSAAGAITGFVGKIFGGGSENFAKNLNKTLDELDKSKIDMYANSLENLGNAMTSLRSGMVGSTTASASATGDKLDQLNNTMEQILMAMTDNNRYSRITSQATVETAENYG